MLEVPQISILLSHSCSGDVLDVCNFRFHPADVPRMSGMDAELGLVHLASPQCPPVLKPGEKLGRALVSRGQRGQRQGEGRPCFEGLRDGDTSDLAQVCAQRRQQVGVYPIQDQRPGTRERIMLMSQKMFSEQRLVTWVGVQETVAHHRWRLEVTMFPSNCPEPQNTRTSQRCAGY